jgi:hypothetical protein
LSLAGEPTLSSDENRFARRRANNLVSAAALAKLGTAGSVIEYVEQRDAKCKELKD